MKQLFSAFFMLLATTAFAQQAPTPTIVPFTIEKNCIYIYCKVNDVDSLKFLFDTGADGSVINQQSADKVKLKIDGASLNVGSNGSNQVSQSSNNTIALGAIVQKNITFTLIPYETTSFDGVFGNNLMRDYIIEIDYNRKVMTLHAAKGFDKDMAGYDKCKLYFPGNYMSVQCGLVINGKKLKGIFGLDSGADNILTLAAPFARSANILKQLPKVGSSTSQGSDGSTYETLMVLMPEVNFAEKHFYNIYTDVSLSTEGIDATTDKAGFFGNAFLKRFNTVIDMPHGYIYFKPNSLLYSSFFED